MVQVVFPLHFGGLVPEGWLHSDWQFEPTVLVLAFASLAGYFWLVGPYARRHEKPVTSDGKKIAFLASSFSLVVALGPPLDDWASSYLLSAHMAQHLILMMLTAPLLLKGLPAWFFDPLSRHRRIDAAGRFLTSAVPSLVIGSALTVVWHLPNLYDRALVVEQVHVVQHNAFLLAAVLMWWPVVRPNPAWPEMQPLVQMLYLFGTTLPGGFVGAFITLAEPGLYRHYLTVPRLWDISLSSDQQVAGLMMWVGVPSVFLLIITVVFFRWVSSEERKDRDAEAAGRRASAQGPVA
jgi:cytochrome c oxidase assembly factor CtaG